MAKLGLAMVVDSLIAVILLFAFYIFPKMICRSIYLEKMILIGRHNKSQQDSGVP
jgi:hypothetical protein